ncbi:MAG TPA: DUF2194 domain-containing protein [Chloroflexi bacterium]|nr:DUF2194 domain-containing protein [Chloroflexota bacterium]
MNRKLNFIAKLIGVLLDTFDRGVPLPGVSRAINPLYLFIILTIAVTGFSFGVWWINRPVYADVSEQKFLIIHDSADRYGEMCYRETTKALDYAKITYDSLDLSEGKELPDLDSYLGLIFTTESLYKLDEEACRRIKVFVAEGGGLTVLYVGWNPHFKDLFGIANEPNIIETEKGMRFKEDFFPGVKGLELPEERFPSLPTLNATLDVHLVSGNRILVTSLSGNRPLMWVRDYGKGRVLFWNAQWLSDMETRGFIVQSILATPGLAVSSIANIGLIQIDDFPQEVIVKELEPIKSEYNLSMVEFYEKVWLPDILELGRRYDLKYTSFLIFNYNERTEPPFDFKGWEQAKVQIGWQKMPYGIFVSHQLSQRSDWELGLHGYNHKSLTLKNWGSVDRMVEALEEARERWLKDSLGELPFSYVPPHNIYDAAGMEALAEAFPSIKVVSGMAIGKFEEGSNREFGPEPWHEGFFDIPRWTWGEVLDSENKFRFLSEIGTFGIWTHFIHPDDVYHTPQNYPEAEKWRNPHSLPWRGDHTGEKNGLYYGLVKWFEFVRKYYPWLRYMTTKEAYYELRKYLDIEASYTLKPDEVIAKFSDYPIYFQVRINDGRTLDLNKMSNCQLVDIYEGEGYTIYTLRAVGREVRLKLILPGEF